MIHKGDPPFQTTQQTTSRTALPQAMLTHAPEHVGATEAIDHADESVFHKGRYY